MKKEVFQVPSVAQKAKQDFLESSIDKIVLALDSLNPNQTILVQASEFPKRSEGAYGSRRAYREGQYLALHQPELVRDIKPTQKLNELVRDVPVRLRNLRKDYNDIIGYQMTPVGWRNRDSEPKLVPFISLAQGALLNAYAKHNASIEVERIYADNPQCEEKGGIVHVSVPSEEEKHHRYQLKYSRVPVSDSIKVALSLKSEHVNPSPKFQVYDDSFSRHGFRFRQHEIAGYLGVIKGLGKSYPSLITQNPFLVFGPQVMENFFKIRNQLLVHDPEIKHKSKLRHARLAEQSLMLGRMLGVYGEDALRKKSDPLLANYDCFSYLKPQ